MLKEEDPNNEETALSEIKIEAEETCAENDFTQDPFLDKEQDLDEGDIDLEISKLEG